MEEYSTKDIARLTDMAESTVRKYAQLLEKSNYGFIRNAHGNRIFTEKDIKIFLELKTKPKDEKPIEEIASDIARNYGAKAATSKLEKSGEAQLNQGFDDDILATLIKKVDELADMHHKQLEFNQALMRKLDQQEQTYMGDRLDQRDRNLIESLRESQGKRKALKRNFFSRLFAGE